MKPSRDNPISACTSSVAPVCTSYTTVLDSVLADWRENSPMSAASRRANSVSRKISMPSLAMRVSAYWPTNCAAPRKAKMPMMATGTIHSESEPCVNPRSSRGLSSAGISGSVMAPTSVATMASTQIGRWLPKYSDRRRSRSRSFSGGWSGGAGSGRAGGSGTCMYAEFYGSPL